MKIYQEERSIDGILTGVMKWIIIILIGAIVFYLLCPKYSFNSKTIDGSYVRENKITGKVEVFSQDTKKWQSLKKRIGWSQSARLSIIAWALATISGGDWTAWYSSVNRSWMYGLPPQWLNQPFMTDRPSM